MFLLYLILCSFITCWALHCLWLLSYYLLYNLQRGYCIVDDIVILIFIYIILFFFTFLEWGISRIILSFIIVIHSFKG
ncbi:hypothetical protein BF1271 [Bacteroides fragilis YCH46]|uniref:Transmembrane protein n=1 Tax=Bacteroides fragilis (strain YCH46) TaxID=295405 RepID=Q64WV5_BACFR|nr:hypothetical protein BF1271 [Bacteroides fragilis YCH46]